MENQHKKITGYRDLSQEEIDLMNEIKARGRELDRLIDRVEEANAGEKLTSRSEAHRWSEIARTELQVVIMALTRAVAKPEFF